MKLLPSRHIVKVGFLLFIGATLGPPILGSIWYLLSEFHSEDSEMEHKASLLVDRADRLNSFFPFTGNLPEAEIPKSQCELQALNLSVSKPPGGNYDKEKKKQAESLFKLAGMAQSSLQQEYRQALYYDQVSSWGDSKIGALDACIASTALSPLCLKYIEQQLRDIPATELQAAADKAAAESNILWCKARDAHLNYLGMDALHDEIVEIQPLQKGRIP
jgi:hypothetical protein